MIGRILVSLAWSACLLAAQQPACRTIAADRILGRDLAAALPALAALPAETLVASAPLPGSRRIMRGPEILALARNHAIALETADDICFEWAMQPLDRALVLQAMQEALAMPEIKIEITDLLALPVPPGRIEFPRAQLGTPASSNPRTPVSWRGQVVYGDNRKFSISAKVTIVGNCARLVAADNLKPGLPLDSAQLREEIVPCFPVAAKTPLSLADAAGRAPVRPLTAGTVLRPEMLTAANDVNRGDEVRVEVRSGAARLGLVGLALNAGRRGDSISIRNRDNNKIFQARINGKGTAVVEAGRPNGS